MKKKLNAKMITMLGMLLALEIVLSRWLSIQTSITRIGFGFVPLVMAGILFGPVAAAIVAVLADILGALLFPTGAFFPGLTVTACLVGIVYGLFLYKKDFDPKNIKDWLRIIALVVVRQGVLALLLQSFWLSILWGSEYKAVLVTRIHQCLILAAVELIMIPILVKIAGRVKKAVNI